MKIAHLSMYDTAGGAARAGYRLHSGLRALGHESIFCTRYRFSSDPDVRQLLFQPDLVQRVQGRLRRQSMARALGRYAATRPAGLECFSSDRSIYPAEALQLPPSDVVNLHWVAELLDYAGFFPATAAHTPIVWTLHDMAALTGGCHYDWGCGRWKKACGACPQLGSSEENDLSRTAWRRKERALAQVPAERLHIVAPSRWLGETARRSSLLGRFPVSVIPYGLDMEDFAPRDRRAARAVLNLPQDKAVVLFAAASTTNLRKGFSCLVEALSGLAAHHEVMLCSLGGGRPEIPANLPHVHLGQVENDRLISMVYSAADLFVLPSLEDNLPCTGLEALACGTPIIGSNVGGIPDIVRPGETGILVPPADAAALCRAMEALLEDRLLRERLSVRCREVALEEYALALQAKRYEAIYETMTGMAGARELPARAVSQGAAKAGLGC